MQGSDTPVADIARVIQLAIAPVFLLTAIATTLGVLNTRLARVVDRARVLREKLRAAAPADAVVIRGELHALARRRRLVNFAITSGVSGAILVCLLIATAFIGSILHVHIAYALAVLFILAMIALVGALSTFLREIFLAVRTTEVEER
jgi:hypothetical protein